LLSFPNCAPWIEVPVDVEPNEKDPKIIECITKEIILKNQEGIILSSGNRIQKNYINKSDIYFKDDRFITNEKLGKIISVGDKGAMSLCDINYPEFNVEYKNSAKIVKDHVYMYVSLDGNIRAEIRIKSYQKSKQIKISYHVRID
jgi:hypothetical protein